MEDYTSGLLVEDDPALDAALAASVAAGLPPHQVSPAQGKLLHLLARIARAETILEIGTLGGYSTIWLARALSEGGRLVTIEAVGAYAEVARANIAAAGLAGKVEVVTGTALDSLRSLSEEGSGPFDLVFIDADKPSNPAYLEWALQLTRPGSVIVADNVVRDGAVARAGTGDAIIEGIRRFLEMVAADARLTGVVTQTVGPKGHDGFAVVLVS